MAAGRSGDARRLFLFDDDSAGIGEMSLVSFQITVMLNSFQYLSQVAAKPYISPPLFIATRMISRSASVTDGFGRRGAPPS